MNALIHMNSILASTGINECLNNSKNLNEPFKFFIGDYFSI
ncbi:hypothetical protein C923_00851 [Plasmodium falciparum UGT5.1]|uniref:Uncharacterized protein n=1 Tax=Plasmodium falciparum UGT5.1 TaxID=1237627 RepID=W7K3I8_PLAFA|nr:hypothetical protein C923_00851 [Plasmodium falciparum UGT5.1]